MSDVISMIMRDIEDDNSIKARDIIVEAKAKGLVKRRRYVHIHGSIDSTVAKDKVTRIAEHHAGDNYDVVNELAVKK